MKLNWVVDNQKAERELRCGPLEEMERKPPNCLFTVSSWKGVKICFWKDPWCDELPLCWSLPSVYKNANIQQCLDNGSLGCLVVRISTLGGISLIEKGYLILLFFSIVGTRWVIPRTSDRLSWRCNSSGIHYVNSSYDILEGEWGVQILGKMLWNPLLPSKVNFFLLGKSRGEKF